MKHTYIIAEAGVNHNGKENLAFQLVDVAISAGADAVKFQTFKADHLVTQTTPKAKYQAITTGIDESQYDMLKRLELPHELHFKLNDYCKQHHIDFLSTAFDIESLHFLTNELGLITLKIPSGEITNAPLILEYAKTQNNIILSTGGSTLDEVEEALGVIAFGFLTPRSLPSQEAFKEAYSSKEGKKLLKQRVTLLHCTSEYPAPYTDIHLRGMDLMSEYFGIPVGYSDHTQGIAIPIAAVARGATIIEKHFTLDQSLEGPDHKASLSPNQLHDMASSIRIVEQALGQKIKQPAPSELENKKLIRKSIIATQIIKKDECFTTHNITIKRPSNGIAPIKYWDLLGKKASQTYRENEHISE